VSESLSVLVGTYTDPGLHLATRTDSGWRVERSIAGTRNASFGVWSPRHRKLYLVREDPEGAIDVVAPDEDWRHIGRFATGGSEPCHCALDHSEMFLAVANYGSGDVTVFTLNPQNGLLMPAPWTHRESGHGPNAERQEGPHAHWVGFAPDGRWLLAADLGIDRVLAFPFHGAGGIGKPETALAAEAGSGPRWLAFPGPGTHALIVSELASTLTMANLADGKLETVTRCSTRPEGATGDNLAGHIVATGDGARVYVTNRGDDAIAAFTVAAQSLTLDFAVPSGGASPRFLALLDDEATLLVGHEKQGPVGEFAVRGGSLERVGELGIEKAAWLAPSPVAQR
jgi:6-phosphogluconolactonase